jgi:hypothetical protein
VPERTGVLTEITSDQLTTENTQGELSFFATKFTGKAPLIFHTEIPVTLEPDNPLLKLLPPIPLNLEFNEVTVDLVYVQSQKLTATNIAIKEIRA